LEGFTGPGWEQEDDITIVTLERTICAPSSSLPDGEGNEASDTTWHRLAYFSLSSVPGNEIEAMNQVVKAVEELRLPKLRQERLKTAVSETAMNAIEYGNENLPEMPVSVEVLTSDDRLSVRITDHGGTQPIPELQAPNLEAKLAGQQTPRGWGLFLIRNMVDEMHVTNHDAYHTVELVFYLHGGQDADTNI